MFNTDGAKPIKGSYSATYYSEYCLARRPPRPARHATTTKPTTEPPAGALAPSFLNRLSLRKAQRAASEEEACPVAHASTKLRSSLRACRRLIRR